MAESVAAELPQTNATETHCPFGCTLNECWNGERGYCDHLVGFSNDGKTFEPLTVDNRGFANVKAGKKRKEVQKVNKDKHILVNPEYAQVDNGAVHLAKKWVSARVYMKKPEHSAELTEHIAAVAAGETKDVS